MCNNPIFRSCFIPHKYKYILDRNRFINERSGAYNRSSLCTSVVNISGHSLDVDSHLDLLTTYQRKKILMSMTFFCHGITYEQKTEEYLKLFFISSRISSYDKFEKLLPQGIACSLPIVSIGVSLNYYCGQDTDQPTE